jgi:hypothetical protein
MRDHTANRRPTDSGVDLICGHHVFSNLPQNYLGREIRTGVIAAALTSGGTPAPYLLLARSSTSLTPLRMSNQIGLADAGYRGELIARVDYFGKEFTSMRFRLDVVCFRSFSTTGCRLRMS